MERDGGTKRERWRGTRRGIEKTEEKEETRETERRKKTGEWECAIERERATSEKEKHSDR